MSKTFRYPNAAGRFFPADPAVLGDEVDRLTAEAARVFAPLPSAPLAVISPHAGYRYSGVLTAAAIGAAAAGSYRRVAILSPSHKHAFEGLALPSEDGFDVGGVRLEVLKSARQRLVKDGLVQVLDAAHDHEHGIETQLPFIARHFPKAKIVPLVIGKATSAQVASVVDALHGMGRDETLFVLSSDLSHFLNRQQAIDSDLSAAALIETGRGAALTSAHACGARAISGFLASAAGQGARALRLGMTSSYPVTGDADRVVGYGAWSLHRPEDAILGDAFRADLLRAARMALGGRLANGRVPQVNLSSFSPRLHTVAASFVTLEIDGRLRGCIGSMAAHRALVLDVVENAVKAGFADPRFKPLTRNELASVSIKISVLTRARPLRFDTETGARKQLQPGVSGAILTAGRHRGVFLPQVWDSLPTKNAFLRGLKRKAGLPEDFWSPEVGLEEFRSETFAEAARNTAER